MLLRTVDGALLEFDRTGRLIRRDELNGMHIELRYYGFLESAPCNAGAKPTSLGLLCQVIVTDGVSADEWSVVMTRYEPTTCVEAPDCTSGGGPFEGDSVLQEVRFGRGLDPQLFVHRTRYIYETVPRINGAGTKDVTRLTTLLVAVVKEDRIGTNWVEVDSENLEYTHDAQVVALLDPSDAEPLSIALLGSIHDARGELVEEYRYDSLGRGTASVSRGELLRVDYVDISDVERRTIVSNESTGAEIEYALSKGRLDAISENCGCGVAPTGDFERDPDGRVFAKRALDPDPFDAMLGMRTVFTRDATGRIVVRLDNWEAGPVQPRDISVVVDPLAGPTRVQRLEYGREVISLPRVDSKVFSALCPRASAAFGLSCPASFGEPRLERVFDATETRVDAEVSTGLTFDPATGSIIEQSRTRSTFFVPGSNRIDSMVDPTGQIRSFVYYATDTEVDPCSGAALPNTHNVGQLKEVWVNGVLLEERGKYDTLGRMGCSIDQNGVETTLFYDARGRITERQTQLGSDLRVSQFQYRPDGQLELSSTGEVERQLEYFSGTAQLPSPTDPTLCDILDPAVDPTSFGQCLDALGHLGQVTREIMRSGPDAQVVETREHAYGRNGLRRLTSVKNAAGQLRRQSGFAYDPNGQLTQQFKYIDQPAQDPADPSLGAAFVRSMTYDGVGRLRSTQAERFSTPNREVSYDALGRIESVTVGLGMVDESTTLYAYDVHDNLAQVTDGDGRVTEYLYDDFGQLILVRSPDSGDTRYVYDLSGNLIRKQDADGRVSVFQYDGRHRLSAEFFDVDPANLPATPDREYLYNAPSQAAATFACGSRSVDFEQALVAGRLATVHHEAGRTYFSHSPFGEVVSVFEQAGALFDPCSLRITRYTYDSAGRLASVTYPSHRVVRYIYEAGALGPTRVELDEPDAQGAVTTSVVLDRLTYDVGNVLSGHVAGGVSFSGDWDLAGQATQRSYLATPGKHFDWSITARDGSGNIESVGDVTTGKQFVVGYDGQDRVDSATGTLLRGYQDCAYTYDGAGNRVTESCYGTPITYAYATGTNELTELSWETAYLAMCTTDPLATVVTQRPIQRDVVGRATSGYRRKYPLADGGDNFELIYGSNGRVAGVDTDLDGVAEVTYVYDHRGLRVRKQTTLGDVSYTYDLSGRLLAEDVGGESREYVFLPNGELVAMLASPAVAGATAQSHVLGVDHLGTPMRAWDMSTGETSWAADYEVFGAASTYLPESTALPDIQINIRLPGQYFDAETGLHYNWWRYYDPGTGRYLTPEPLLVDHRFVPVQTSFQPQRVHPYGYVAHSPLLFVDRDGRFVDPGTGVVGGIVIGFGATVAAAGAAALGVGVLIGTGINLLLEDPIQGALTPFLPDECEEDPEEQCNELNRIDTATCNGITRLRGPRAGAICHASASQRLAECFRFGIGGVRTPLTTWAN